MKNILRISILGLFLLSPFMHPSSAYAAVVINEIFPKPGDGDVSQQWVELYNNGSEAVSLDRWKLQKSVGADPKEFSMNASIVIQPKGFWTFDQSQLNISLNKEGDTVKLFDASNNQVDSQSFPSTLGYNTSIGRSVDGAGVWTICDTATWTKNKSNNCVAPTAAPTTVPVPTVIPTSIPPSATPFLEPSIVPTFIVPTRSDSEPQVLGVTIAPSSIDTIVHASASSTEQKTNNRPLGIMMIVIAVALGLLALIATLHTRYNERKNTT